MLLSLTSFVHFKNPAEGTMNKTTTIIVILILGALATAGIDALLNINIHKDVGSFFAIIHKVTYMAWGGITVKLGKQ